MNKIISALLVLCMLLSAAMSFSGVGAVTHGYQRCDANDDGDIDSKDILLVRKYMAGLVSEKDVNLLAADCNDDGDVDSKDLLYLRKVMAGLIDLDENNTDGAYRVGMISVGGKNISRYTIVYGKDADECVKYSADQLRKYIRLACGVNLNVAYDSSNIESYRISFAKDTDNLYELGDEGFRIDVAEDGNITLTCGKERGALYGTYAFLEDLVGYRFLTLDVDYVYEAEVKDIPLGYTDTQVPVLSYRAVAQGGCTVDNFAMLRANAVDSEGSRACTSPKYGGGVGTLYLHAHSFAYQMAGFEHAYDQEYVAPYHNIQPCLTSETTYQNIINFNLALLDERNKAGQKFGLHYTQISCSPNDNTNFCTCTKCKAIYVEEASIAGAVMRLTNRVAETLEEYYPDIEIYTIAYAGGNIPPKYTVPRKNVCLCFCISGCNNHPYDNTELCNEAGGNERLRWPTTYGGHSVPNNNSNDISYFHKWCEVCDNVYLWYYSANFNYYCSPAANLFNVYNDFKFAASLGITGIYSEGSSASAYSFEMLRGYLVSKMLWDPFMSEEEFEGHMNEFLMIYYGDGWEYMREYINMSNYASDLNGCWTNNFDQPWNIYNKEYFKNNYGKMCELLDKCLEMAKTPEQKRRIERSSLHMHFLGLSATYEKDYVKGSSASKAEYKKRYEWLWNYYNTYGYSSSNPDGIKLTSFISEKAGGSNFPESASIIIEPMKWIYDDFSGEWESVVDYEGKC